MPRKETCIHALEVDDETGDIWTTCSNLPVGKLQSDRLRRSCREGPFWYLTLASADLSRQLFEIAVT
jgi:hypothetical protein